MVSNFIFAMDSTGCEELGGLGGLTRFWRKSHFRPNHLGTAALVGTGLPNRCFTVFDRARRVYTGAVFGARDDL